MSSTNSKKWIADDMHLKCPECGRFMAKSEDGLWWHCEQCDELVMSGAAQM
jgi:ribosomal protein S27AE